MLTSKQRSELRSQANTLDTLLTVGKGGVSESLIAEAEILLDTKELVKGKVLETALLTAREASDAICEATGADGVQTIGTKFVIYRKSAKLEAQRKEKAKAAKKVNPVRAGVQARRKRARAEKEKRQQYFHEAAVQAAIDRRREKESMN